MAVVAYVISSTDLYHSSNHDIPGLVDFLKSYCKLCSVLAEELCTKYSLELSDLELEDISELTISVSDTDELTNGNNACRSYST